ncbi:MAG: GNAT family N-acetyltransferase [Oscillospiraceae bacterium]|nr:GNAT family N-acetyltransferase [Oscillospiraceae bacterium]
MDIQNIDQPNRERIDAFIVRQWFSMQMVVHGESIDLSEAAGYYAMEDDEIIGLITYRITDNEMEILSLDSLRENKGIGTALLNKVTLKAVEIGCSKIKLITTNDNLAALWFYQKRGFDMVRLYCNALEQSRKIKPEIPLIGENGIPLKHEIELEMSL